MEKRKMKKGKMHYEPPYIEVLEVEMEQMIAGTVKTKSSEIKADWGSDQEVNPTPDVVIDL